MSTETTRLRMHSSHRVPIGVKKEGLSDIPNEIVIYEILSNIIYKTEDDSELKINDLFGYFKNDWKYREVYQVWDNIKIDPMCKCTDIKKILKLERLTSLTIVKCEKIETICHLKRLTSLYLLGCDKIETIHHLERLTSLSLCLCNKIEAIPKLEKLTSLTITKCNQIESISKLERLTSLTLYGCYIDVIISIFLWWLFEYYSLIDIFMGKIKKW